MRNHKIEKIYNEYYPIVYKYLCCITNSQDLAEDLTQETFVIAVKEINKFREDCKVSVWLCQIAKHLWYKQLKKSKKENNIMLDELDEFAESKGIEDIICKKEEKIDFFKDIQKLDETSRNIIYLRVIGNLNFIEIGEILGKTPNWARVTFYRAKQKLKEVNKNGKES